MRNFFRRLRDSFRNRRSPGARPPGTKKSRGRKIVDDVLMDTGVKRKDADYYSRLPGRKAASQQALADMKRRRDKRRDRNKNNDTTETAPTEEVTNVTENTETNTNPTTLDETTNTALTNVENISNQTFDNTDNISNYFDNTATSVNTAAAQEQNQASALTTSVGEAEDEAISYMTSGTGSNILTSAQGLLGDDEDEDDPFNRRKTLIGA